MPSVRDERGYNQGWSGTEVLELREARRCSLLASKIIPGETQTVLEIGCGRGAMARQLARTTGMQVLGVDISKQFIAQAQANAIEDNVRFAVADCARPEGLRGARFDYIVGSGILHHLYQELDASLERIRGLLKDGGRIVFLEPNLHNPYVYLIFSRPGLRERAKLEPDEMAFTKAFITDRLGAAGFRGVEVEYRDFLVPGTPPWLVRPVVGFGRIAEGIAGLKHLAQSLFISARA